MPAELDRPHWPFRLVPIVVCAAGLLFVAGGTLFHASARGPGSNPDQPDAAALNPELRVLERDLTSSEYREVLETMIPTDLAAEWWRVATPDNYLLFLRAHGGKEAVLADEKLKAAFERRQQIAQQFLDLMRAAYAKRGVKTAPFDRGSRLEDLLLRAEERSVQQLASSSPTVRVVMPAAGAEQQWPRFRGPTGQGVAIEPHFPMHWSETDNLAWKTDLTGRGHSSPVVWDDRIFLTSASEEGYERLLLCYSRTDGKLLWQRIAPKPTQLEGLYWKNSFASSTPVTDGERVIAFFGNSGLVCFDFEGDLQWQQELGPFTTMHGPGTSPLLYRDKVIFIQYQNRGPTQFVAFDKRTGKPRWQHDREDGTCWSTPVVLRVGDHDELVYNSSHQVIGYDPQNGEELWRVSGSSREAIPMILVGGGLIYSTSGRNGPTLAIRPGGEGDVSQTHLVWKTRRGGPHVPSPAYFDGRLYLVGDMGVITCLNAETGDLLWQKRLRGRFSMSPIEADGKLILTNESGTTFILDASQRDYTLLATNELDDTILATPAVLGGRIYVRTVSRLICLEEKNSKTTGAGG